MDQQRQQRETEAQQAYQEAKQELVRQPASLGNKVGGDAADAVQDVEDDVTTSKDAFLRWKDEIEHRIESVEATLIRRRIL